MSNDMFYRNEIMEDLLTFIDIIKEFENSYKLIKKGNMEYEVMDDEFIECFNIEGNYEAEDNVIKSIEKEIPDTWIDEIEDFTERMNVISTENLIMINKIINLGKDLINNEKISKKVIVIQNEYICNSLEEEYYEDREDIIEELFSKRGDILIKCAELGAEKLHLI